MITDGSDKELTHWYQKGFFKSPRVTVGVGIGRWASQMSKSTMHYWTEEENDKQRGLGNTECREPERETFRKGKCCFIMEVKK